MEKITAAVLGVLLMMTATAQAKTTEPSGAKGHSGVEEVR